MQIQRKNKTILVAEDEVEVRAYLDMALKYLGYSVELVQDGEEAINAVRAGSFKYDAVLLDLILPRRDGMEVLAEIKEMSPDLPVIVISGTGSTMNIVAAMKSGATDFLCKPVGHDELAHALNKALDREPHATGPLPVAQPAPVLPRTKAFFGSSPAMREIQSLIGHVGWSESSCTDPG